MVGNFVFLATDCIGFRCFVCRYLLIAFVAIVRSTELIVYITRTGRKYHTYACEFLREHNVKNKVAIYFDAIVKPKSK